MKKYLVLLYLPLLSISACSNELDEKTAEKSSKEQIFNAQTEALEKAKQVEQMIQSGVDNNQKLIEQQTR